MLLNWMQMQSRSHQRGILKRNLGVGGVEDHDDVLKPTEVSAVGVELHHDEAWGLARACVQEMQVGLHFGEGVHVEQAGGAADLQEFAEGVTSMRNVHGPRSERRIGEQRLHD